MFNFGFFITIRVLTPLAICQYPKKTKKNEKNEKKKKLLVYWLSANKQW
jgi:hypothetical protein